MLTVRKEPSALDSPVSGKVNKPTLAATTMITPRMAPRRATGYHHRIASGTTAQGAVNAREYSGKVAHWAYGVGRWESAEGRR